MIDHTGVTVSDLALSKEFYRKALQPIGCRVLAEFPAEVTGGADVAELVKAFHRAALAAGGRDNGAPGERPHYHEHYFGAFVLDPDGHNIEAVCHDPAT
jgi:catechol 2,3-dioxygenase-like lactoylglutathione lyase family enzyme